MTIDDGSILLPSGVGKTVSLQGNQLTFVHPDPTDAYSFIDWITPPGLPSPPLHIHWVTDEAFYGCHRECCVTTSCKKRL